MEGGDQILSFCGMFLREPTHIFMEDEMGSTQYIPQEEGGEQGDRLMPMLFALGQHRALEGIHARMRAGEHVMAFMDDIYTVCRRMEDVHVAVEDGLTTQADIHVHRGKKTQVWNRGGVESSGIEGMTNAARILQPDALVWPDDPSLPSAQQGMKVLGIPIGQHEYVQELLERKTRQQQVFFQRIPSVNDTQAAFLLFMMCVDRSDLRTQKIVPDAMTRMCGRASERFQGHHMLHRQLVFSTLALSAGGLGLASAARVRAAAQLGQLGGTETRSPQG